MIRRKRNNPAARASDGPERSAPRYASSRARPSGFVLLITMVILVVLVVLGYRVTGQVAAQRHRLQYEIDYAKARYACDSALKYTLARVETLVPSLVARPNEPDFSAVFSLDEEAYQELLLEYRMELEQQGVYFEDPLIDMEDANLIEEGHDVNGVFDADNPLSDLDTSDLFIRGPYGPQWPQVIPPIEFEIGDAQVRIEIEDENAKYPLPWLLVKDSPQSREIESGFEAFLEWMGYSLTDVLDLKEQLDAIRVLRPYTLEFKAPPASPAAAKNANPVRRTPTRGRITRPTTAASKTGGKPLNPAEQAARQTTDVARFFNSSLLDLELLARPSIESDTRQESALKYIGLWGASKVNINTAPRHVLESAFMFGGHTRAIALADAVIERRRWEPIPDLEELKKLLLGSADAIEKCQDYITMTSTHFTVRIEISIGVAQTRAVMAMVKEGDKVRKLAVVSG